MYRASLDYCKDLRFWFKWGEVLEIWTEGLAPFFLSLSMEAFLRIECGKQVEKYRDDYETIEIIQVRDSTGSG